MYNTCSFTGHRQISIKHREKLKELLSRAISYVYENGCRSFYAGGALGFDTMAAEAVIAFRASHPDVKLFLILPCKNQAVRWGERDRYIYNRIISEADGAEYIADEYYDGCMKERNLRLAELSDVMIAYVGKSYSGSMQTLKLAQSLGKECYNIFPHCRE